MDDPPDRRQALLTVKEVAARLHLTKQTVYALIRSGLLDAGNVGKGSQKVYRISPDAVDAFVTMKEER